jgi:hypothetical protein
MKNKILIIFLIITLCGCIDDVLDRKPLNLISDSDVWQSEQLVDIYLVALYDAIPFGFSTSPATYQANFTDESSYHEENPPVSNYGSAAIALNTTMYPWIRRANYFLEKINASTLEGSKVLSLVAECRFIRAYYYFDLVKKYGGMPIVNEVQTFDNNLNELQVPRNKEDEVYDFILTELDAAIEDLPETRDAANGNRATKSTALALKSRAMLYAGSIAKYGTIQLDGLVGIPATNAAKYFTESLNASKAIIESNRFALYDELYNPASQTGDPAANYQQIFVAKGNKEIILQKAYKFPDKPHSWDNLNIPEGFTTNQGSAICPLLNLVEAYEYVDGSEGTLVVDGLEFDSPDDLYANKDPRFHASIFRSETPYVGRNVQIYRGIYDTDGTLYETESVPFPKDPSVSQVGKDGPFPTGNYSKTGFYIRKITNPSKAVVEPGFSDQNYIDIRYAEILLNYTEAALELGTDLPGALDAINQVRNRAGIALLDASGLTIDRLRNERRVELAFEDKRFWDIRRWRIGTQLFQNTYMEGLYPYLKYDGTSYKYIFKKVSGYPVDGGLSRIFNQRDYYSDLSAGPITAPGYISSNKNIINNPQW